MSQIEVLATLLFAGISGLLLYMISNSYNCNNKIVNAKYIYYLVKPDRVFSIFTDYKLDSYEINGIAEDSSGEYFVVSKKPIPPNYIKYIHCSI